jgi:hypothetical protein
VETFEIGKIRPVLKLNIITNKQFSKLARHGLTKPIPCLLPEIAVSQAQIAANQSLETTRYGICFCSCLLSHAVRSVRALDFP